MGKGSNMIKIINSELIHNKSYLNAEKRFNAKERFQCFYKSVILFDSIFRKDGNHYVKVLFEKHSKRFLEKYKF